jgi:hypothetical protein
MWVALLLGVLLWQLPVSTARAAPVVLIMDRGLSFGTCEYTAGSTYVVAAAEDPGTGACPGATSARFQVSADPARRLRITAANRIDITNGTGTLRVNYTQSPSGNAACSGAGTLTIYMGGSVTTQSGLSPLGLFSAGDTLTVDYQGAGSC